MSSIVNPQLIENLRPLITEMANQAVARNVVPVINEEVFVTLPEIGSGDDVIFDTPLEPEPEEVVVGLSLEDIVLHTRHVLFLKNGKLYIQR